MVESSNQKLLHNTLMMYILSITKLILPLITLPYLTRVLSTECYGSVSFAKSIISYMQIIIDFGFVYSGTKDIIACNGNQDEINRVVSNTLLAKLILSVFAFIIFIIVMLSFEKSKDMLLYSVLSYIATFLTIFLCDFFFKGIEQMKVITYRFLISRLTSTVLTFVFIKGDSDVLWIPILDIMGVLFAVIFVFLSMKKRNVRLVRASFKIAWQKIKESFIYFINALSSTTFNALNTFLIGIFLTNTDTAYWGLVLQLVTAVQALYTPITEASYPRMLQEKDPRIIKHILLIYMPIISLGCLLVWFAGEPILYLIAGEKYANAAHLLVYLIPVLFFSFPSMLLGWPTLGALNMQKEVSITTIISAIVQILGLCILRLTNSFTLFNVIIIRNITEIVLCLIRTIVCYRNRHLFTREQPSSEVSTTST